MRTIINIHEAKTNLSRIVDDVAAGAEVVIAKAGKPMVRLVPLAAAPRAKRLGLLRGRIKVPDDFNEPLAADVLDEFSSG